MRVCNSLLRPDRRKYNAFKIQNIFIESRNVKSRGALLLPVSAVNTTPRIVNMHTWGLLNGQWDDIVAGRSTQSRKFIRAFAQAVTLLYCNWSSPRRCFDSSSVTSSSSSPSFTGSEDAVRDVLYGLHIADEIYIYIYIFVRGTCITRGKEAWRRRGRPRGRPVNWSPQRYRWSTATDAIVMERLPRSAR